jgi:hypothetical protein
MRIYTGEMWFGPHIKLYVFQLPLSGKLFNNYSFLCESNVCVSSVTRLQYRVTIILHSSIIYTWLEIPSWVGHQREEYVKYVEKVRGSVQKN